VQFVDLIESPSTRIILEYLPLGSLEDLAARRRITFQDSIAIFCQGLNAVTSLHGADIAHRDIKPANMLVNSEDPLHIKVSDFGVSRATSDTLKTFCGTHVYAAPEIHQIPRRYTKACDIWSIAIVFFKYAYGLPNFNKEEDKGLPWCHKIIQRLIDWTSDHWLDFLATKMLIMQPEKRHSAKNCLVQALQLSALSKSRCATPTQAAYKGDWATPSATEVATFVRMEALQSNTNMGSSQATVDHYLIDYNKEQEVEFQQRTSSTEVSKYLPFCHA